MADIISIATAVPAHCHKQSEILLFMQDIYGLGETDKRKLGFLYSHSGIENRYSVIGDYGNESRNGEFIPQSAEAPFPTLEQRMEIYDKESVLISANAIRDCLSGIIDPSQVTHLITVSCTGMSAPGLDLQLMGALNMDPALFRTSVNFMGCYAAIHALKLAKMICDSTPDANVVLVATEFCTLHFQKEYTMDNAASSLLFADGSAAVLVSNCLSSPKQLSLKGFYSQVVQKGKADMAWQLSSKGFLMTLSGYIPQLIQEDIQSLVDKILEKNHMQKEEVTHWCIHPGGKRILDVIQKQLELPETALDPSRKILKEYGNMSSPTVLFVLKEMMNNMNGTPSKILGMAFGPGLTLETFMVES